MRAHGLLGLSLLFAVSLMSCTPRGEVIALGVGDTVLRVEIARTVEKRAQGLMGRKSLPWDAGMLFVFEADERLDFWMKNTTIPLSIAFLSSSGKITEIRDMRPLSQDIVRSRLACRYALEVNVGALARAGVEEGDTVALPPGFR